MKLEEGNIIEHGYSKSQLKKKKKKKRRDKREKLALNPRKEI